MTLDKAFSPGTQRMGRTIWRWLAHYFYGMFAKSFNSGMVAIDSVVGLAVGAAATTDIAKPNWQAAVAVFGVTFARSCLAYFKDNPIPEKLPETHPPFPQERQP